MTSSTPNEPADDVSLSWGLADGDAPSAAPPTPLQPLEAPDVLMGRVVGGIHDSLPSAWSYFTVEIGIAGDEHRTRGAAEMPDGRLLPLSLTEDQLLALATHRQLTVEPVPWMWLRITQNRGMHPEVTGFDGFVGAPPEHLLFPPAAYRADISMSDDVAKPLWLLAHVNGSSERQLRSATVAASATPADCVHPRDELPPLTLLWPRFAALSAIFAAVNAFDGPRMSAATGVFRGERGGCSLSRLPGGRAVFSGGADHSALMTAAYLGEIESPDLYRGAPAWVNNLVLDERAAAGMLTFCYWGTGTRWSRAELAGPEGWTAVDDLVPAVPGVWTSRSTATLIAETLRQAGIEVNDSDAVDYVAQVTGGNPRPDLLLALPASRASVAEGLAVLDVAQSW